ncbi:protein translocase subunit SecF [bacterium]|mgnify:FL=1|uniref:Protein-export membrane protein SecF n=1 Tax=Candidatus Scatenecus faecavium TaxID=2840915 RepID=A0A9D1K4S5_9BACT|nr:protein translocase subunit SecF [bacterium]HIS83423.1 protein translocase subunit SecF [Candidatus Scatenecus faecavium]
MLNIGRKHLVHIVKFRWWWMALTTLLLVPGIIAMIYSSVTYSNHAPLKVGIDYTGGTILQYGIVEKVTNNDLAKMRETLEEKGIENPYLQILNVNSDQQKNTASEIQSIISVRTKFIDKDSTDGDKITEVMQEQYSNPELMSVSSVGPTMGKELFKNSLIAVTLAFLGIVAYLSFRFRFDYALAAILGVLHDVLFVVGVFSILGLVYNVQIDGLFITAILTVIGFSVHDTIVVFDRIRENLRYYSKKMSFGEIVDASVNQTLTRSINTSLTTLITLLALYFFGGVTTRDFVLAMILGIIIGTYSSIFFCSMLVDFWNDKQQKKDAVAV